MACYKCSSPVCLDLQNIEKSMDSENSSLSSMVSHTHLRMDEFDHATSMSHQLPSSKTKSGPREHSLTMVAHRKSSIQPKRSLPEEIMKRNFKTFSPSNVVVKIPTESKLKDYVDLMLLKLSRINQTLY